MKRGIAAKKLRLRIGGDHEHHQHHGHRRAAEILAMIDGSGLPPRVKQRSRAIFHAIALAEGKIHGKNPDDVHFHEVGAMDSILDIIEGCAFALESLAIAEVYASPVPAGEIRKSADGPRVVSRFRRRPPRNCWPAFPCPTGTAEGGTDHADGGGHPEDAW